MRIDHNSPDYRASVEGLKKLEEKLRGLNDYPDPEDKEQQRAEIYAMRPLMSAVRVRCGPDCVSSDWPNVAHQKSARQGFEHARKDRSCADRKTGARFGCGKSTQPTVTAG